METNMNNNAGMNEIDRQIISLISKRAKFTKQNGRPDSETMERIIKEIRTWAYRENVNADMAENIYRQLVMYFATIT